MIAIVQSAFIFQIQRIIAMINNDYANNQNISMMTCKLYKSILILQKYIENDSFLTIFPYLSTSYTIISLDHNQDISVIGDSFMIQNVT